MKRFIRITLVFLLPLIVIAIVSESFTRSLPNSYKYKHDYIQKNGEGIKTMILGNSTTNTAINPIFLDSTFSFANPAQLLEYDFYILKEYHKYCKNLRNVIIPLDYVNLFHPEYEKANDNSWYLSIYYRIYLNYPKHSIFSKYNYEISNPLSFRNKAMLYLSSLITKKEYGKGCDSLGHAVGGRDFHYADDEDINDLAVIKYLNRSSEMNIPVNSLYVDSIANYCQSHQLELIMVTCPKWHGLVEKLDPNRLRTIGSVAEEVTKKYSCANYKNYLYDSLFIYDKRFFLDVTHMSEFGSERFTRGLINDFNCLAN